VGYEAVTSDPSDSANPEPQPTVVKVIHQYFAEYPDDPRIKRIIHVLSIGEEKVVFELT
jgi:hypothetical protein